MRRLLVLVLCLHLAAAIDTDGDGYEDHDEVLSGGNPFQAESTPYSDDDGNGQSNEEGVQTLEYRNPTSPLRWITHSTFVEGGSYGVAYVRSGQDGEPPCGLGRSVEKVRVCGGTVYVYDPVCLPGASGDYDACREDGAGGLYDGYGWWSVPARGAL